MFFEKLEDVPRIMESVNCGVFVVPKEKMVEIKNTMILEPRGKTTISIEQVHDVIDTLKTKQNLDRFIVIRPAELLSVEAANAILKNLEEPQEKVHFLLITDQPSKLLPTILSRAETYVWRGGITKINEIKADEKTKALAKRLLAAKNSEIADLAEEICKKEDGTRAFALSILGVAIEMAYKSYFMTKKAVFLKKIPNLIKAYDSISSNGHIKLRLVADLI